jgi:hypothetical protein
MSGEVDREERTKWTGRAWAGLLSLADWLGLIEEGYERPESLAKRAQVVTDALTDASDLLGELQAEGEGTLGRYRISHCRDRKRATPSRGCCPDQTRRHGLIRFKGSARHRIAGSATASGLDDGS